MRAHPLRPSDVQTHHHADIEARFSLAAAGSGRPLQQEGDLSVHNDVLAGTEPRPRLRCYGAGGGGTLKTWVRTSADTSRFGTRAVQLSSSTCAADQWFEARPISTSRDSSFCSKHFGLPFPLIRVSASRDTVQSHRSSLHFSANRLLQKRISHPERNWVGHPGGDSPGDFRTESTSESRSESARDAEIESTGDSKDELSGDSSNDSPNQPWVEAESNSPNESTSDFRSESTNQSKSESASDLPNDSSSQSRIRDVRGFAGDDAGCVGGRNRGCNRTGKARYGSISGQTGGAKNAQVGYARSSERRGRRCACSGHARFGTRGHDPKPRPVSVMSPESRGYAGFAIARFFSATGSFSMA
jgi:hypothetical protein